MQSMELRANREKFRELLAKEYADLFANNTDYSYSASLNTPEGLAAKMMAALTRGSANKDGIAIRRVCKALGLKHTYRDIESFIGLGDIPQ